MKQKIQPKFFLIVTNGQLVPPMKGWNVVIESRVIATSGKIGYVLRKFM